MRVQARVYGGGVPLFSLTEPVIPNTQQITAKDVLRIPDTGFQHSLRGDSHGENSRSDSKQRAHTLPLTLPIQGNGRKFRPDLG